MREILYFIQKFTLIPNLVLTINEDFCVYKFFNFKKSKMKKTALVIIAAFTLICSLAYSADKPKNTKPAPKRFFVAKTDFGALARDIKAIKIDASLNFAAKASMGKYEYVPFAALDSIFEQTKSKGDTLTSLTLSKKLNADFFVFVRVNRIENMLRIDISRINARDTSQRHFGTGYASVRYRKLTNEKPMYDPAILTAIMRAFAVASGDSSLFVIDDSVKVKPVPTLVIGGINYKDDEKLKSWEVFTHKEISSYDAVENIFDEIKDNDNFAIYDIQTRDSVFSLFNLLLIENYLGPSPNELKILSQMDVDYYITGSLTHTESGGLIDLFLCRIGKNGYLEVLGKETGLVMEDSIKEFNKTIRQTISGLMAKKLWIKKL